MSVMATVAIAGATALVNEFQRKSALKAESKKMRMDALSLRAQANENLRRQRNNLLMTGKEFESRTNQIQAGGAGAGIQVESMGDLVMNEAGNLLEQAGIESEQYMADHLTQMRTATNMERQANSLSDSANKFMGIF